MFKLKERSLDICFLQATFMKKKDDAKVAEIKESELEIDSCPRVCRLRGGLAVTHTPTRNMKINTKVTKYKTFEYMEMEVTLKADHDILRFMNIYRAPCSKANKITTTDFLLKFDEFLETIHTKTGITILIGDFNIHLETSKDNVFLSTCPTPNSAHRLGGTLDLIVTYVFIKHKVKNAEVLDHGTKSDHYMVTYELDYTTTPNTTDKNLVTASFKI